MDGGRSILIVYHLGPFLGAVQGAETISIGLVLTPDPSGRSSPATTINLRSRSGFLVIAMILTTTLAKEHLYLRVHVADKHKAVRATTELAFALLPGPALHLVRTAFVQNTFHRYTLDTETSTNLVEPACIGHYSLLSGK